MDCVRSWLDAEEVGRLAQRLLVGRGEVLLPTAETPLGAAFEGFTGEVGPAPAAAAPPSPAGPPPLPPAEPATPAEPAAAPVATASVAAAAPGPAAVVVVPAELSEAAEPVVDARPPEPPRGPFLQRVQRLRDWLREQFAVRGMFLLDREGVVIFDDGVNEKLHGLARSLAHTSRNAGGACSNVHVKIGAEATLEVIPVLTRYGLLVLGAVAPQAVPPTGVAMIIDALQRTATPP
jgi:hypothetical protein